MSGQPYDVHAHLQGPVDDLAFYLGRWEDRDDGKAQPQVRRAANTAMDRIDAMLATLHAMRSRLVTEIRASDDAAAARAGALLSNQDHGPDIACDILPPVVPGYLAGVRVRRDAGREGRYLP